ALDDRTRVTLDPQAATVVRGGDVAAHRDRDVRGRRSDEPDGALTAHDLVALDHRAGSRVVGEDAGRAPTRGDVVRVGDAIEADDADGVVADLDAVLRRVTDVEAPAAADHGVLDPEQRVEAADDAALAPLVHEAVAHRHLAGVADAVAAHVDRGRALRAAERIGADVDDFDILDRAVAAVTDVDAVQPAVRRHPERA